MKLLQLINKDVRFENESRKGIVSLRLLCIIQAFAFILAVIFAGPDVFAVFKIKFIVSLLIIIGLFVLTYFAKTEPAIICYIVFTLLWIIAMIPAFSWSGGMQNYFILILMLCFFTTHGSNSFKFTLTGLILAARICCIICFAGTPAVAYLSDMSNKLIQITNIAAVYMGIIAISFIFSYHEIAEENKLMRYNDLLMKEANTDQLTGLYNRRRGEELLEEFKDSTFLGSISIVMGDIDFFKKVNDTYGHDAGDEVLKSIAEIMRQNCGKEAFLTRWGGEEFLLIFGGKNGDETHGIIEELRHKIVNNVVTVKDNEIKVTMTFGVAEYDFSGDIHTTVKEADDKLYMGKDAGRNRVVY